MTSEIKVNVIKKSSGSTITIGESGDTISLATGASQSGFGRSGTVDWITSVKTNSDSPLTVVNGKGYFLNTTSGTITVNLPAGSAGDIVAFKDYANTWDTNNVTISPNGSDKINGEAADTTLSTEDQSVTLVFVDSTKGWRVVQDSTSNVTGNPYLQATGGTITTCGNCKIHTFTSPGTFTVTTAAQCSANNAVSHLVIAGGGGGSVQGGGGGAGGFREVKSPVTPYTASPLDGYPSSPNRITVTATGYPITVGAGGGGACFPSPRMGAKGSDSVFSSITSAGGGGGKGYSTSAPVAAPGFMNGGSGGGGASGPGSSNPAGTGNTPPTTPPQGNNGGSSSGDSGDFNGAGGGGAGGAGTNSPGTGGGKAGGSGATTSINGTPTARAGGGGGGGWNASSPGPASAGGGAGGSPGPSTNNAGVAGTANTGGGGGSSMSPDVNNYYAKGGNGGSGVVIIRYRFQ
jgi:hypothetical protein